MILHRRSGLTPGLTRHARVLALMAAAGCSPAFEAAGNTDVEAGANNPPLVGRDAGVPNAQEYVTAYYEAACDRLLECCGKPVNAETRKICEGRVTLGALAPYEASLDLRDVRYFPEAAGKCLALVREASCRQGTAEASRKLREACSAVFQGSLGGGVSGCRTSLDCQPGLYCERTSDGGACKPFHGVGQSCTANHSVGNGSLRVPPGEAISRAREQCGYEAPRWDPLFCDLPDRVAEGGQAVGVCRRALAPGAPCDMGDQGCGDGHCDARTRLCVATWSLSLACPP
jgi:hypothetical protein